MPVKKATPQQAVIEVYQQVDAKIKSIEENAIKSFVSTALSTASLTMLVVKNEILDVYEDQMFDRGKKRSKRITDGW